MVDTVNKRRTRAEMAVWRQALIAALAEGPHPMTLRQLFYRCVSRKLVEKNENWYTTLSFEFVRFRVDGDVPWDQLADNTREANFTWSNEGPGRLDEVKREVLASLTDPVRNVADGHYINLWHDIDFRLQIWLEKDALRLIVENIADGFEVAVNVARGFSSVSFLHEAAEQFNAWGKPMTILYLADYDPSGIMAMQTGVRRLQELCHVPITVRQLAVLPEQIDDWDLPTRPTKIHSASGKVLGHAKHWDPDVDSVELDAIPPDRFNDLIRNALLEYMPQERIDRVRQMEDDECAELEEWGERVADRVDDAVRDIIDEEG